MTRRSQRQKAIFDPDREELLRRAYSLWQLACAAQAGVIVGFEDYRISHELTRALCVFAERISSGRTNFGHMQASSPNGVAQTWLDRTDEFADAVDEVVQLCGGDPHTAIRSLLVLTDYLEAEAEGTKLTGDPKHCGSTTTEHKLSTSASAHQMDTRPRNWLCADGLTLPRGP